MMCSESNGMLLWFRHIENTWCVQVYLFIFLEMLQASKNFLLLHSHFLLKLWKTSEKIHIWDGPITFFLLPADVNWDFHMKTSVFFPFCWQFYSKSILGNESAEEHSGSTCLFSWVINVLPCCIILGLKDYQSWGWHFQIPQLLDQKPKSVNPKLQSCSVYHQRMEKKILWFIWRGGQLIFSAFLIL